MMNEIDDLLFDFARSLAENGTIEDCNLLLSLCPNIAETNPSVSDSSRKAIFAVCLACFEADTGTEIQKCLLRYLLCVVKSLLRFDFNTLRFLYSESPEFELSTLENFSFVLIDCLSCLTALCEDEMAKQIGLCQIGLIQRIISAIEECSDKPTEQPESKILGHLPLLIGSLRSMGRVHEKAIICNVAYGLSLSSDPFVSTKQFLTNSVSLANGFQRLNMVSDTVSKGLERTLSSQHLVDNDNTVQFDQSNVLSANYLLNVNCSTVQVNQPWNDFVWPYRLMRSLLHKLLCTNVLHMVDKFAYNDRYLSNNEHSRLTAFPYVAPTQTLVLSCLKLCFDILIRSSEEFMYSFEELPSILDKWQKLSLTSFCICEQSQFICYQTEAESFRLSVFTARTEQEAEAILSTCNEYFTNPTTTLESFYLKVPLYRASIDVLVQLVTVKPSLSVFVIRCLRDIIAKPSPLLRSLYDVMVGHKSVPAGMTTSSTIQRFALMEGTCFYLPESNNISDKASIVAKHTFDFLLNAIINGLCKVLKQSQKASTDSSEIFSSLQFSLVGRLSSLDSSSSLSYLVANLVVCTLGQFVIQLSNDQQEGYKGRGFNTSTILASFQQMVLDKRKKWMRHLIFLQLSKIIANSPEFCQSDIIDLLTTEIVHGYDTVSITSSLSSSIHSEQIVKTRKMMALSMSVLAILASTVNNPQISADLMTRVIELFINIAQRAKSTSGLNVKQLNSITKDIGVMGMLLPIIATLLQRHPDPISNVNSKCQKLFRNLWIMLSFLGFGNNTQGTWPGEWTKHVQTVAIHSPPIVSREHLRNLEYNFPFRTKNVTKPEIQVLKSILMSELGGLESKYLLERLTYVQLSYLYAIYTLESLRTLHAPCDNGFRNMFVYLEELAIQRDKSDMWKCISLIGCKCFILHMQRLKSMTLNQKRDEYLIDLAFLLVEKVCSLYQPLSTASYNWLLTLLSKDRFPHLIWDYRLLQLLIDVVELLDRSLSAETRNEICDLLTIRDTNIHLLYHDAYSQRQELYQRMRTVCKNVIQQAFNFVPLITKSHIQHYIFKSDLWKIDIQNHAGLNIALEMLQQSASGKHNRLIDRAQFIALLNQRVFFVGFIDGIEPDRSASTEQLFIDELSACSNGFCFRRNVFVRNRSSAKFESNEACKILIKMTAWVVRRQDSPNTRLLIHAIAWVPAVIFTEQIVITAINCWSWIFSAKRDLRTKLTCEIVSAFEFTAQNQMGLFQKRPSVTDPFAPSGEKCKTGTIVPNSFRPHKLWLEFLEEHLMAALYNSSEIIGLYCSMFYNCLSFNEESVQLNNNVIAAGLYFRFLIMAFRIVRDENACDILDKERLVERIVHTAFQYFAGPCEHPNQSADTLKEDIESLGQFFQYVSAEKALIRAKHKSGYQSDDASSSPPGQDVAASTLLVQAIPQIPAPMLLNSAGLSSSYNSSLKITGQTGIFRTASSKDIRGTPNSVRQSTISDRVSIISNKSFYRFRNDAPSGLRTDYSFMKATDPLASGEKRKNILLILIAAEMKRLKVHYNLLMRSNATFQSRMYPIMESWYADQMYSAGIAQVEEWTEIAWIESINIAGNLRTRLRKEATDRKLSQLIANDPLRARSCAPAFRILNSYPLYANTLRDNPVILTWQCLNPVDALAYFFSNIPLYKSPMVLQVACQSLLKFNLATLMLYIPQLVQALRRNELGIPAYLILTLSKRSDMLAHQFIWNMQANRWLGNTKELDPMVALLDDIISRIQSGFSQSSLQFYETENSFVEDIVDVSSKIKKYEKGHNRKLACKKEFSEVQYRSNCYLPSNPEGVVLSIDYGSATPMQSAAKAPYRANFKVLTVGAERLEYAAKHGQSFDISNTGQLSVNDQMAIFKVGDDVRQDILALQLIRIFKCIFDNEDLELSLHPYSVVATAHERGVIECVRNAMSRDEIGRKVEGDMFHYFCTTYGDRDTATFQQARQNFVKSMAGYSVVLFMLQVKDRHNGNIMVDKDGHIIHIDFGFLFETSPGGNLGFEPDIKLTDEMILIMGGSMEASSFDWFKELCVKGYLSLRTYRQQICDLVTMMLDTKLPCFLGHTIEQLNTRFQPDMDDAQAADYILAMIYNCTRAIRTHLYDIFQYHQNQIPY